MANKDMIINALNELSEHRRKRIFDLMQTKSDDTSNNIRANGGF